jgi:ribulose kinase
MSDSVDQRKNTALWMFHSAVKRCVNKAKEIQQTDPQNVQRIHALMLIIEHMTNCVMNLQDPTDDGISIGFGYYLRTIESI